MDTYIIKSELEKIIAKSNAFIKEEDLLLEEYKSSFINCSYLCKTKNTSKLSELANDLNKSLNVINNNCRNNVIVLMKTINKYIETENNVAAMFNSIKTE